jgi:hypothetical protein
VCIYSGFISTFIAWQETSDTKFSVIDAMSSKLHGARFFPIRQTVNHVVLVNDIQILSIKVLLECTDGIGR